MPTGSNQETFDCSQKIHVHPEPCGLNPNPKPNGRIHRLVGANGRKFLREMYTREIYEKVFCFDHWAANLPPREAEVVPHSQPLAEDCSVCFVAPMLSAKCECAVS
jgi:hypothetical protein